MVWLGAEVVEAEDWPDICRVLSAVAATVWGMKLSKYSAIHDVDTHLLLTEGIELLVLLQVQVGDAAQRLRGNLLETVPSVIIVALINLHLNKHG